MAMPSNEYFCGLIIVVVIVVVYLQLEDTVIKYH